MLEDDDTNKEALKLSNPSALIATFFGCGLIPFAPGTWGTIGGLFFVMFVLSFFGSSALPIALALICFLAIWSIDSIQKQTKTHDDSSIVIDEVAGLILAFILLPEITLKTGALAFLLFRAFDILKPWPISSFDANMKGAAGVLVDDLLAAFFAGLVIIGLDYAEYI